MLKIGRRRQNRAEGSTTSAPRFYELQARQNGGYDEATTPPGQPEHTGPTELDNPELLMRNGLAFIRAC